MKSENFESVKFAKKVAQEQMKFYNSMMAEKDAKESLSHIYMREQIAEKMKPFHDIYKESNMPKETKKKLYLVDTIVTFRHKYVVEADELEHAYDEVTMLDSSSGEDDFIEVTQRYLGETITDGREITKKEFKKLLKDLEKDKNENSSYWLGTDLIRKIDYNR